jgi:hypothetical protein
MDLIEQYLRTKLLERDDITTKSGYIIKILSSYIGNSDIERLRSKIANNNAQNNGCVQGFVIVAKRKGKSNDNATASDSELYDDIVAAMQSNQTLMKYYNKDYRIILSEPRSSSRDRRKVYAAWILDMRESSRFKILLNRISSIFNKIDDLNWTRQTEAFKFLTDDVIIIPQKTAIKWTESIENFLQNLQDKDAYTYNRLFPANDKYSKRILNSIPNFNEMLSGVKIDQEQDQVLDINVKIDADWVQKNKNIPFRGYAKVITSPVTGELVITPVSGKLFIRWHV